MGGPGSGRRGGNLYKQRKAVAKSFYKKWRKEYPSKTRRQRRAIASTARQTAQKSIRRSVRF